ncbi:hypothetical protein HanRHA438_Chr10g0461211 [Helianthus annuus]|nr:hypothetical protein HanRHA438_Chr10g0461211 [Helianthus annuus]
MLMAPHPKMTPIAPPVVVFGALWGAIRQKNPNITPHYEGPKNILVLKTTLFFFIKISATSRAQLWKRSAVCGPHLQEKRWTKGLQSARKRVFVLHITLLFSHTNTYRNTHNTSSLSLPFIYHHHLIYHHHHNRCNHHHHRTPTPVATTTTTTHPRRNYHHHHNYPPCRNHHHHHRTPTATTVTGRIEGERSREEREIKGGDEREEGFRFGGFICLHLPPPPPPSPLHHNHHRHLLTVCSPVTLIPVLSFRIDGFRNRIFRFGDFFLVQMRVWCRSGGGGRVEVAAGEGGRWWQRMWWCLLEWREKRLCRP